jgi:WD40 repeat protein
VPASHRAIVLALAASTILACEDPFTNTPPADSPGAVVTGVGSVCTFPFGCSAWSADSKTLYITAFNSEGVTLGGTFTSLIAVDPATHASRAVGPIDDESGNLEATADGTALFFAAHDNETGNWVIKRMSLLDGSTTTLAETPLLTFVVSPDGASLAYHAVHSAGAADSIVVLDPRSGSRRATMATSGGILAAFSADGTRLSVIPGSGRTIQIWNLTTGVLDTIPVSRANSIFVGAAWSGGTLRMLSVVRVGPPTYIDTSLAGGSALTYSVVQEPTRFLWLPDRSAMWTIPASPICGPQDCYLSRYDFVFATAITAVTVGNANSLELRLVSASPDGHWIAHAEDAGVLRLLHQPAP